MPEFLSQGVHIAYEVYGEGPPVLLIHGFASNGAVNWLDTGWVESLTVAGYQAITIDNRGHGISEKIYDPAIYDARIMAVDAANLIDHLGYEKVAVMGYSMGTRISAFLCIDMPEKVAAAVFGGMGIHMVRPRGKSGEITAALLADSLEDVEGATGRQFRRFAEHTKSDLKALAACMSSPSSPITIEELRTIEVPVLVAVGSDDEVAGSPEELAALMPKGEVFVIERRDHMRATGDPSYKSAALTFLKGNYPIVI